MSHTPCEECAKLKSINAELLEVCKEFADRIKECIFCNGSGMEPNQTDDACHECGGQGRIMGHCDGLISDLEAAIAKAERES